MCNAPVKSLSLTYQQPAFYKRFLLPKQQFRAKGKYHIPQFSQPKLTWGLQLSALEALCNFALYKSTLHYITFTFSPSLITKWLPLMRVVELLVSPLTPVSLYLLATQSSKFVWVSFICVGYMCPQSQRATKKYDMITVVRQYIVPGIRKFYSAKYI